MTSRKNLKFPKKPRSTSKKNKHPIKNSQKSKNRMKKKSQKKMRGGDISLYELIQDLGVIKKLKESQQSFFEKLVNYLNTHKTGVNTSQASTTLEKITLILNKDEITTEELKKQFLETLKECKMEQDYFQYLIEHFDRTGNIPHTPDGKKRKSSV